MTQKPISDSEIFRAAAVLTPDKRPAFLDKACGDNHSLRHEIESLLRAHDPDGSFLQSPAIAVTITQPISERPGSTIGPYKLREQIGEGGFGIVYVAEQERPVRRKVALKVIKPGMDTKDVIARFEAERQALALMDHPNVARVLDAGTTDSGRPYFVMELVHGVPVTEYCDKNKLATRERLLLFGDVCRAVQHAHQKGIIHRDLKPSNIMVTLHDGKPVAKVIDFGVSKAISQQLTEKSIYTAYGQMIGTPVYMSPEQAEMSGLGIDTRSDIYSLGVLLYELLTGKTPLDLTRVREAGYGEMLRMIREEEPPRPSMKISTLGDEATAIAQHRHTDPNQLRRSLRGELDWIVMKCLEKDRARRYETASGLARDLERYLHDEPVEACPPSVSYRLRKFARRNKRALATAALVSLLLLVALGSVSGSIGWLVRDQEARRTRLAGQLELILNEVKQQERDEKWPEALAAARRAEALLAGGGGDLELNRQVQDVLADLKLVQRLEDIRLEGAERMMGGNGFKWTDNAYALAFREAGMDLEGATEDEVAERVRSRAHIALALVVILDDWATWKAMLGNSAGSQALDGAAQSIDPDPWRHNVRTAMANEDFHALENLAASPDLARQSPATLGLLGAALLWYRKFDLAVLVLRKAQERYPSDFWCNCILASSLQNLGPAHQDESIGFYRAAIAVRPHCATVWALVGNVYRTQRRYDAAIASFKKAIEIDPKYSGSYKYLADTLKSQGRLEEARVAYQVASNHLQDAIGADPGDATAHHSLGLVQTEQKRLDEAIASFRRAIELDGQRGNYYWGLGRVLERQNKPEEAIACFKTAIAVDPNYFNSYLSLCSLLINKGAIDEANEFLQKAVELEPTNAEIHNHRGEVLRKQKKLDDAVAAFRLAIEINPQYATAHNRLGNTLRDQRKLDEAVAAYRKVVEFDPKNARAYTDLGHALRGQNKLEEGIAAFRQAIEIDPKYASAYVGLGYALRGQNKLEEGIAAFRQAIEIDPKHASAYVGLGNALRDQRKLDEAMAVFRLAIEYDPKNAGAYTGLGNALCDQNKLDDAITAYRQAIEFDPKNHWAHTGVGNVLREQRKLAEAAAAYRKAIESNPQYAWAYAGLGMVLRDRGEFDEAISGFRKALELDPNSADFHRKLAWLLATCRDRKLRDPVQAVSLAKLAVKFDPDNAESYATLGAAYYASGDWKAASDAIEKSMELRSGGSSIEWFFLAMAHWQLGDKDKARRWYDQAADWMDKNQPDDEELRRFRAEAAELMGLRPVVLPVVPVTR